MTDILDDLIEALLTDPDTRLSAAAKNALHGARSNHPWGRDKPPGQRAREAWAAIAGRHVAGTYRHEISRLAVAAHQEALA